MASGLGFLGTRASGCCKTPCPGFPLHTVEMCLSLNMYTSAALAIGCLVDDDTCETLNPDIHYAWPETLDSWGRKCRVVKWVRQIPDGQFLRIRLCAAAGLCDVTCPDRAAPGYVPNQLLSLKIDGADVVDRIQAVANAGGRDGCVRAWCTNGESGAVNLTGTDDCCKYEFEVTPTPVAASALVTGTFYQITSIGGTDFTDGGAVANTVGLTFQKDASVLTGSGTATPVLVASAMIIGQWYTIQTTTSGVAGLLGLTTNFTLYGAASNAPGTRFLCTAAGAGTGTVLGSLVYWNADDNTPLDLPHSAEIVYGPLGAV